ncbi:unnamed protein product [Urochloa decumbens]|uniref:RRM domain-containing protein n=1 Tax=Urochloa decumbens TaxID=240449 RepID=A0ABC8W7G6_9POAL
MPVKTMAYAALASPPWADLPPDLLADISSRLHAASDNARFLAVCRAWRAAGVRDGYAPRRSLLPWLLAPSSAATVDEAEDQRCRCIFSKTTYRAPGICVRDRRVAYAKGGAAWLVRGKDEISLVNPLSAARSTTFPSAGGECLMSDEWLDYRHRIVSDDGCVLLYNFDPSMYHDNLTNFRASFLSPGHRKWLRVSSYNSSGSCCAAACYRSRYVVWVDRAYCHVLRPHWRRLAHLPDEPGKARRCSYLLTYRGELLLASLLRDKASGDVSVSLHEFRLKNGHSGDEHMKLDFSVEAARFGGELRGGAAYFVLNGWKGKPCRVYRYSFRGGGGARVVETLPAGWHDTKCMWFLPDPQISPAFDLDPPEEGTEPAASSSDLLLLQSSNRGSAQRRQQLTIYARNLSPKVDNSGLRETFSVYGKVVRARVAYDTHTRGGWSQEFGFVTMATQEGYDKAMAALNRPKAVKKAPAVDNSVTMLEWFLVLLLLLLLILVFLYVFQRLARYGFSLFRNGVARMLM